MGTEMGWWAQGGDKGHKEGTGGHMEGTANIEKGQRVY